MRFVFGLNNLQCDVCACVCVCWCCVFLCLCCSFYFLLFLFFHSFKLFISWSSVFSWFPLSPQFLFVASLSFHLLAFKSYNSTIFVVFHSHSTAFFFAEAYSIFFSCDLCHSRDSVFFASTVFYSLYSTSFGLLSYWNDRTPFNIFFNAELPIAGLPRANMDKDRGQECEAKRAVEKEERGKQGETETDKERTREGE